MKTLKGEIDPILVILIFLGLTSIALAVGNYINELAERNTAYTFTREDGTTGLAPLCYENAIGNRFCEMKNGNKISVKSFQWVEKNK